MHYVFLEGGLANELAAISPREVINHLGNHLGNFFLDAVVCATYVNRLGTVPQSQHSNATHKWMHYLLQKYAHLNPLDERAVTLWSNVSGTRPDYLDDLSENRLPEAVQEWLDNASWKLDPEELRGRLLDLLKEHPSAPPVLTRLVENDLHLNIPAGDGWYDKLHLSPSLKSILDRIILEALHIQEDNDRALELLHKLPAQAENPYWLNTAAEVYARNNDRKHAAALYKNSLRLDPEQGPIQFRLKELLRPFRADPATLSKQTAIFLYSWNKCELLKSTLESLAKSDIGNSSITVLLNGCTDDSTAMARHLNQTLFGQRLQIIDLPVNIGAPAARNWLLATKEAQEADFVAFLDDDVDVPVNWLTSLLTTLQENSEAGVAGAKIINPGSPRRLQYLYRNIAVAREGLIRLSLDTPNRNFDTGAYDFVRETDNVMGCCHVFTRAALEAVPFFDIRFSPSQMDDISHDLDLRIKGFKVIYCGLVACCHHQMSGMGRNAPTSLTRKGNVLGNDVKFSYKYFSHIDKLKKFNNLTPISDQR